MKTMLKKSIACLLAVILVIGIVPVTVFAAETATSGQCGDNVYWTLDSNGKVTISGKGEMWNYHMGNSPFYLNSRVKSVVIESGVTSIGRGAFRGCSSLKSVTIPSGVTTIEEVAFGECSSLKSVTIPNSVTKIGGYAFSKCSSLSKVTIGSGVTSIASDALDGTALYKNSSNWKNNVLYIGKYLIKAKTSISGNYTVKDGTKVIAAGAFTDCKKLKNVTIPNSVKTICGAAFYGCEKLSKITIGNGVTSIGSSAFTCTNLDWENDGLYIDKYLIVAQISDSGNYTVRDGTKVIAAGAFSGDALKSVTIPKSVKVIGYSDSAFSIFYGCEDLTNITVDTNNKNYSSKDGVLFNKNKTELIQYPMGKKGTSYAIPSSVKTIGFQAFSRSNLSKVTIPKSVKVIGEGAFYNCTSLKSVTIENGVTTIGDFAFYASDSLTSVTIPNSVKTIGIYAFKDCKKLSKVTIGSGVKTIDDSTFENCCSLKSVTIPSSVTTIFCNAFCCCESLKNVYYVGSKAQWNKIRIDRNNDELTNATIHYNHTHSSKIKKATTSANGSIKYTCSVCGDSTETIAKVSSISLSKTSYTYNGKAKKPTITVKDSNGKILKNGTDYTVTYASGRTKIGSYTVKVKFKGNYSGSKTLTFKIVPANPTLKVTAGNKKATLSWNKITGATGYGIYMATSKNGTYKKIATIKNGSTVKYTKTGLTKGKTYYFKVRAYKTVSKTNVYSAYSAVKSVKVK